MAVRCTKATCRGTVTLFLGTKRISAPKVYALHAGHTETVRVVLDRTGRQRLGRAKHHVLVVRARVTVQGGVTRAVTIRLRPAPVARPVGGLARVHGRTTTLRVACSGATCRGKIGLFAGKAAVSAPKVYALRAGRTGTVRVVLDRALRRRLAQAKHHVLVVRARVTVRGGVTRTAQVRLLA